MRSRHKLHILIPVLGIFLFYLVYGLAGISTGCSIKGFTGVPCPGCGMTRAYLLLLKGNLAGAFYYHPLFPLPAAVASFCLYEYLKNARIPVWVWGISVSLMLVVYLVRMAVFFPDTAPMDYYSGAVIPRIIRFLLDRLH